MSQVDGFTGIFSPNNWTKTIDNTTNGGSITFSVDGNSVTIVSDDNFNEIAVDTKICSIQFPYNALVTFNYNYKTIDRDGPLYDPFGYYTGTNGDFIQISDNNGPNEQSGSYSVQVNKGKEFCFVQKCTDQQLGPATTIISNFKVVFIYTVSYNSNGGSGYIDNQTGTLNQVITLSDGTGFDLTGFNLTSWNTQENGNGIKYNLGSIYTITDQDITLYAIWTPKIYVISVDEVNDYYFSYLNENSTYVNIYTSESFNTVFIEYLKDEIGNYVENIEA